MPTPGTVTETLTIQIKYDISWKNYEFCIYASGEDTSRIFFDILIYQ